MSIVDDVKECGSLEIRFSQVKTCFEAGLYIHFEEEWDDHYCLWRQRCFAATPEWVGDYIRSGGTWAYNHVPKGETT